MFNKRRAKGGGEDLRRLNRERVAVVQRDLGAEAFDRLEKFVKRHGIVPCALPPHRRELCPMPMTGRRAKVATSRPSAHVDPFCSSTGELSRWHYTKHPLSCIPHSSIFRAVLL